LLFSPSQLLSFLKLTDLSLSLSQLDRNKVALDLLLAVCGGGVNMGFCEGFDDGCFGRGVMDLVVLGFWVSDLG
jgi:hypothetical protein